MVLTKSMTAAKKAAKAVQEQAAAGAATGLPSPGDGAHVVPHPQDEELVDEMIGEELRIDLEKMVDAMEQERRSRQKGEWAREADSQKLWLTIGELKEMMAEVLGHVGGGRGGGTGGDGSAAGAAAGGAAALALAPKAPVVAAKAPAVATRGRR
ncbi:unnamed protein product [Linum trigynum]|uniref:Uncharacterized protein n=1 Tax=Linum trigynum TaxID=586398 RepID=A0AAV2CTY8_9ROSI